MEIDREAEFVGSKEREKNIPVKVNHRDSDASVGSNHLMVAGLYDDNTQHDESPNNEENKQNEPSRQDSTDSCCLSPTDGEQCSPETSRRISVIDVKSVNAKREQLQREKVARQGAEVDKYIADNEDYKTNARYIGTNPFVNDGLEYSNYNNTNTTNGSSFIAAGRLPPSEMAASGVDLTQRYTYAEQRSIPEQDEVWIERNFPLVGPDENGGLYYSLDTAQQKPLGVGVTPFGHDDYDAWSDGMSQNPLQTFSGKKEAQLNSGGYYNQKTSKLSRQLPDHQHSMASQKAHPRSEQTVYGNNDNSISLVLFNKTDANIIISDEPETAACWEEIGNATETDSSADNQGGGADYLSEDDNMTARSQFLNDQVRDENTIPPGSPMSSSSRQIPLRRRSQLEWQQHRPYTSKHRITGQESTTNSPPRNSTQRARVESRELANQQQHRFQPNGRSSSFSPSLDHKLTSGRKYPNHAASDSSPHQEDDEAQSFTSSQLSSRHRYSFYTGDKLIGTKRDKWTGGMNQPSARASERSSERGTSDPISRERQVLTMLTGSGPHVPRARATASNYFNNDSMTRSDTGGNCRQFIKSNAPVWSNEAATLVNYSEFKRMSPNAIKYNKGQRVSERIFQDNPIANDNHTDKFIVDNTAYVTPVRRPQLRIDPNQLDDRRRIDIVITSPKRYAKHQHQPRVSRLQNRSGYLISNQCSTYEQDEEVNMENPVNQSMHRRRVESHARTVQLNQEHHVRNSTGLFNSQGNNHDSGRHKGGRSPLCDQRRVVVNKDVYGNQTAHTGSIERSFEPNTNNPVQTEESTQAKSSHRRQRSTSPHNFNNDSKAQLRSGVKRSGDTNHSGKELSTQQDEKVHPGSKEHQSPISNVNVSAAELRDIQGSDQQSDGVAANGSGEGPRCPLFAVGPSTTNKVVKLRNLLNDGQTVDNLHMKYRHNNQSHGCNEIRCLNSLINAKPIEHKARSNSEILDHAKEFINNFYSSIKRLDSPAHKTRLKEIEEQLNTSETYYLKETELIFGAKLAWRNASRCIGRIQWSKLQVFDARFTTNANEMFEALCNHIKYATNKGSLRSAITIFPQRVKTTDNDWRIWNSQLIGYAGYKDKETGQVMGDPANADFTDICEKLGWKCCKRTRFDVLPLVVSANGGPPQLFPLPDDLVLRVHIRHPKFKWFEELDLQWYALPAVANMMLDVGGLQFTAAPFSGWYMVTEIGTRDLADPTRYNLLEEIARKMDLNTTSNTSLWKDKALVELNFAVLDSFQSAGVTIVDHHTASETFMTHLANEQKLRGGCPADWVWLVPPTSGSTTQVFHQEMVNYHLLPNYEYMEPVWKNFDWVAWERKRKEEVELNRLKSVAAAAEKEKSKAIGFSLGSSNKPNGATNGELTPRKLKFKEIARAVKFTSKLFGKALSRRIKATILFATETGKSERFANKLAQSFSHAFNVHLMSMSDYDMTCLEHEALLLIVTSTFGNGDPPESGELFAKHLAAVKLTGDTTPDLESINSVSTNPFFQMLSEDNKDTSSFEYKDEKIDRLDLIREKQEQQTNIKPLSNVRFGVFALGSTAYPHFCAFGRYIDQTLGDLGAERIMKCSCGDELCGQEKAFNNWSGQIFKIACDVFCLTDTIGPMNESSEVTWRPEDVRFVPIELIGESDTNNNLLVNNITPSKYTRQSSMKSNEILTSKKTILRNLMSISNKRIIPFTVENRIDLHDFKPEENLQTLRIDLESELLKTSTASQSNKQPPVNFEAGDHVAIYPVNKSDTVEQILTKMRKDLDETNSEKTFDFDQVYTILVKRENMDLTPSTAMTTQSNGESSWIPHDRLPVTSIREALTRYLDITSPPNQEFLLLLSRQTVDAEERKRLQQMARNFTIYEEWKNKNVPCLSSVLKEFSTVRFRPELLSQIPLLKPRFYSISGTSISLTLGVVRFKTNSGELREGLCSNYLNCVPIEPRNYVYGYIRSAPAFHMPQDRGIPMILIGAGTGLAPFRAFWQQRYADMYKQTAQQQQNIETNSPNTHSRFGRIELYFGCRNSNYILYRDELDEMYRNGVLSSVNIAFSRPIDSDVLDVNSSKTSNIGFTREMSMVASIKQARKKVYVQDKLLEDSNHVYKLIMFGGAHIYVCGDVAMADGVHKTLVNMINNRSKAMKVASSCDSTPSSAIHDDKSVQDLSSELARTSSDGETVLMNLRNSSRYHEDIFGAKQMS